MLIVGEAPGKKEDESGRPFVGRSGQLLRDNLEKASINDHYITNTVKCRPPNNQNPTEAQKESCRAYLDIQIKIVDPILIIPFGREATNCFLDDVSSLGEAVGRLSMYRDYQLMPMYHPAFILRQRSREDDFLNNLRRVKTIIG